MDFLVILKDLLRQRILVLRVLMGNYLIFFSNKILIIYANWIVTEKRAIIRVMWLYQASIDSSYLRLRRKEKVGLIRYRVSTLSTKGGGSFFPASLWNPVFKFICSDNKYLLSLS